MKELIRFSLFRRFNNKSTKLFNLIIFIVIGCACFSDFIIDFVNPSFNEKEIIYVKGIDENLLQYLNDHGEDAYLFKVLKKKEKTVLNEGNMILESKDNQFVLHSKYELDAMTISSFSVNLTRYHKDKMMDDIEDKELLAAYNQEVIVENKTLKQNEISSDKSNLIFMFVTSVYFMMLSFVSGVASEVVNEKATKTLELILTSVSAKTHFYSKLFVGWLVIVMQGIASISYIIFWLLIRSIYDQGIGVITLIKKLNIIEIKGSNFYSVLVNFDFSFAFFEKVFYILIFLLIGILIVQLVLVIVSSFVSSIEEASNIQAPFYLLLLGFYYLVLAINNPHELSEGIGFYLSFVPFMNMLLMPCRILIQDVPILQMLISASISLYLVYMILTKGSKVYERGVLDYSCKGFIQVLKSMRIKQTK